MSNATERCDPALMDRFFDNELDAQETARAEAHLAGCPSCRRLQQENRVIGDLFRSSLDGVLTAVDKTALEEQVIAQVGRRNSSAWERLRDFFPLGRLIPLARGARRRKQSFENKEKAFQRFAAGRGIFKTWSKEFIQAYLECGLLVKDSESAVLKCDPEMEAQIFESVPGDVWTYVRRAACPVLVMRGELSEAFPAGSARKVKTLRPDWEIRTLPKTGHFFPMEKPAQCAEIILDFITGAGKR